MTNTKNSNLTESLAQFWNDKRLPISVCIALIFNIATAAYTYAGMQAVEGNRPIVTLLFCVALTLIKLIYEKEFCANLFSKRPRKAFFTFVGFVFFLVSAIFFNLLNIVNTQRDELVKATEASAKLERWYNDTESASKALARLRAAASQAVAKNEAARREARRNADTTPAKLEALQQEHKVLMQVEASARSIAALPVTIPVDDRIASELLTKAVASIRNMTALLPLSDATSVGDIHLAQPVSTDGSILTQLGQLFSKGFPTFSKPLFTAIFLELFSVLALIAGYGGLTWAERIEGVKMTADDTYRAIVRSPSQVAIQFLVEGTLTRGTLVLSGNEPVSYPELVLAIDEASAFWPAPVVAMYNSSSELLNPERDVLSQLQGGELIVVVGNL